MDHGAGETTRRFLPDKTGEYILMERVCEVKNKLGLHARASAKLVQLSSAFQSGLSIQFDGQEADGKSILSILTLACPKGSSIRLKAEGPDEEKLLEAIERLIDDKFGEE